VNTGVQIQSIVFNQSGGPRQLHVWFSNTSGSSVVKKANAIPAHSTAINCTPAPTSAYVRNLLYNMGAYWALASAFTSTTSVVCV
jgi:hypothetical protein